MKLSVAFSRTVLSEAVKSSLRSGRPRHGWIAGARAPAIPPCLGRPDLNDDFTAAERTVLENASLNFIDPCVIGKHYTPGIHDTSVLLPWHRGFIGELETSLISQGHPEFVPFPKWDSAKPIPPEFQDVDIPACL